MLSLSIIICTYNRSELLEHCLDSLLKQSANPASYEIIVVDNNSTDDTQQVLRKYQSSNLRSFVEPNQGLSHARNKGAHESKASWLLYLDDDVLVESDLIEKSLEWCDKDGIVGFGGAFGPWFHYGKPHWFRDEYASLKLPYSHPAILQKDEFLFGCVFAVKKEALLRIGGFDPALGMRGSTIGYGEETEVQRVLKNEGGMIMYVPDLCVRHVVNPERLDALWYLQAGWALGRDSVFSGQAKYNGIMLIGVAVVAILLFLSSGFINGLKLLVVKEYYRENWVIDSMRKLMKRAAIIYFNLVPSNSKPADTV